MGRPTASLVHAGSTDGLTRLITGLLAMAMAVLVVGLIAIAILSLLAWRNGRDAQKRDPYTRRARDLDSPKNRNAVHHGLNAALEAVKRIAERCEGLAALCSNREIVARRGLERLAVLLRRVGDFVAEVQAGFTMDTDLVAMSALLSYVFRVAAEPASTSPVRKAVRDAAASDSRGFLALSDCRYVAHEDPKGGLIEQLLRKFEEQSLKPAGCAGSTGILESGAAGRREIAALTILASKLEGICECFEMMQRHAYRNAHGGLSCDVAAARAVRGGAPLVARLQCPGVESHEREALYDSAKLGKHMESFTSTILWANAVVSRAFAKPNVLARTFCYGISGCYYGLCFSHAKRTGEACYAGSRHQVLENLAFASVVWNLPDTPLIKTLYRLHLPSIAVDHVFEALAPSRADGASDPEFRVHARVLSALPLPRLPSRRPLAPRVHGPDLATSTSAAGTDDVGGALVLHLHGGGFISMSSFSHENYTRHWARDLGVPIVSCDYRLAPSHPFPAASDDAYDCYRWCVECAAVELGRPVQRIVLVGDSAGGNLCLSVALRALRDNYRVPDGLMLCYPALDLRREFTPSMLWALEDKVLPFTFVESCLAAYLGGDVAEVDDHGCPTSRALAATKTASNPLASPAAARDDDLRLLPPTRLVVGGRDPLHDQVVRFAHRLGHLGVDSRLVVYDGMCHGFLSFDVPVVGVPEVRPCIHEIAGLLRELVFPPIPVQEIL